MQYMIVDVQIVKLQISTVIGVETVDFSICKGGVRKFI